MMLNWTSHAPQVRWFGWGEKHSRKKQNEEFFSEIKDWDGDLEKGKDLELQECKSNNNQTPKPSPESTSTSDTETLTPQPSKTLVDRYGNQSSVSSEEGQKEETSEDSLEEINWEVCIGDSVYKF